MSYIYKLTLLRDVGNWSTGDVYIGKTEGKYSWYFTGGRLPRNIIKKHGKGVFKKEIIAQGDFNEFLLDSLEKHYIRLYAANIKGLNITGGGVGYTPPSYPIYQYDLSCKYLSSFKSCRDVEEELGLSAVTIAAAARNNKESSGFIWSYDKCDKISPTRPQHWVEVSQYTLEGDYLHTYANKIRASQATCTFGIEKALDNQHRQAGGFQWRTYKVDNCGKLAKIKYIPPPKLFEVHRYTKGGYYDKSFPTLLDAMRGTASRSKKNGLSKVVDNINVLWGGYQWRSYKVDKCEEYTRPSKCRAVEMWSTRGELLKTFRSRSDASRYIGKDRATIMANVDEEGNHQYGGYVWKYAA